MPNVEGQKRWSAVRLLETHELARGGVNGNLNEQAQALADRTEFLNQEKANKSEIVQGVFEFGTYAEFNAAKATLPQNCTVVIGEENTGSGTWGIGNNRWNGVTLTKSTYDPVETSKLFTQQAVNSAESRSNQYSEILAEKLKDYEKAVAVSGKNLFNLKKVQSGRYVSTQGSVVSNSDTNWKTSEYIAVTAGQTYTLNGTFGYTGIGFYSSNTATAPISHAQTLKLPYTFTVPAGATHIVFNLSKPSRPNFSNVQLELGSAATTYEDGFERRLIKSSDVDGLSTLIENAKDEVKNITKQYESKILSSGKNLFNALEDVLTDKLLNTAGKIQSSVGWKCTNFIPVTAGQTYTISGNRGYTSGLAFFSGADVSLTGTNYVEGFILPYTFTVPVGATHVVFNLASNTKPNFSNIQIELGGAATSYEDGFDKISLKLQSVDGLEEYVSEQISTNVSSPKEYELIIPASSKNLFNERTQVVQNQYMHTLTGVVNSNAPDPWSTSTYISVTAGQTFTLSGNFGHGGVGFFADNTSKTPFSFIAQPTYPLTFTVPAGAAYMMFNISSGTVLGSKIQLESGSIATEYEAGYESKKINPDYINQSNLPLDVYCTAQISGNDLNIISGNVEHRTSLTRAFSVIDSPVFNFKTAFIDGVQIANGSDDVPPIYIKGYEIGGNHGYVGAIIKCLAHGKTALDIGSLWNDESGQQCILLDVIDVDNLVLTKTTGNASFSTTQLNFTHISGATNTSDINANTVTSRQVHPVATRHKQSFSADSNTLTKKDGVYKFHDNFTVSESYCLITKAAMIAYVLANSGAKLTSYDSVEPFLSINHVYKFDTEGGCTISTNVVVLEQSSFSKMMLVQAARILGDNLTYYIPKISPFTVGAINYDFAKGVDINGTQKPTSNLLLSGSYVDQEKGVPDRYIQTTNRGSMANGILPTLDGKKSDRLINTTRSFGLISTPLKQYHHFIDSADISNLAAGTCLAGKGYRKYFKNTDVDKISAYAIYDSEADYYVVDYKHNVAKIDVIDLPARLHSREFEVIDKSNNVDVLSKVATSQIHINLIQSESPSYLILKFLG